MSKTQVRRYEGNLILWNPITTEYKFVLMSQTFKDAKIQMFGFGFDSIKKDYKIVRVSNLPSNQGCAEVYNLGSNNSWRAINTVVPTFEFFGRSISNSYLNGVYHRITYKENDEVLRAFIVSFNFSEELFGTIQLPVSTLDDIGFSHTIFVLNESLAFGRYNILTRKCNIWMMNEYDVESSWTSKFDFGPIYNIHSILDFWGDNEILIEDNDGGVISYNLQGQPVHNFTNPNGRDRVNISMNLNPLLTCCLDYVESLIPLLERRKPSEK